MQSLHPGSARQAAADVGDPAARRLHLLVLAASLLWFAFWYRDTLMAMVDIWERSDTFAHGYVIAPISAWLIWRRRHFIRGVPIASSLLGIVIGLGAGAAWLLGELASVDAVSQFAFVGMLVGLVWAVMGTAVVRTYAFPIGFLFFMVPFGEFLFPTMMDWTTHFIIWAVRASGVPVYAEGYNLVIPSGRWQVVEGCSGVRYLMASIVVGSLYAYLNYRSTQKRLLFVIASIIVPIFANWLRAYGIVMLGHLSSNKLAAGADHLVYGWVFFGIIIMALFWIGSRWQEDEELAPVATSQALGGTAPAAGRSSRFAMLGLALAAVSLWNPLLAYLDRQGAHGPVEFAQVASYAEFTPAEVALLPVWSPSYSGMRSEYRAAWSGADRPVGLYIAYYRDQKSGEELINSENRVLISKDPVWKRTASGSPQVKLGADAQTWASLEMVSTQGRMIVWSAYWVGGRWTTNDYLAKVYLALAMLRGEGDDSAAVMVYAPYVEGEHDAAATTLERFLADMGDSLIAMLTQTSAR